MTFIHAYLLGGLVLAGLPVLLHLMLRQKPKRLVFPAFRFLKQRRQVNHRKMQLQRLLLLLLRILVLAALCLALARPRLFSDQLSSVTDRPVIAALVFDTSASMEYTIGGVTRLDEARARARELLDELKPDSRVIVYDSGINAQDALVPPTEARSRLDLLRIRPGAGSLNVTVERALRFLEKQDVGEEGPPRLLYVLTDRSRASWDATGLRPNVPPGVSTYLLDVGAEQPRDLGIERIEIVPPVVAAETRFEVRVTVRGTAEGHENEVSCILDGEDRPPDRRPIQLSKGMTTETVVFERTAPKPTTSALAADVPHQLTVRLGTRDAMNFNNTRYATFHVRIGRKLLTLVDRRDDERTRVWEAAHAATRSFEVEVKTFDEAARLDAKTLASYPVVAIFEAASVPESWWKRLAGYVRGGGGLAIVPGGLEMQADLNDYNQRGLANQVLPAPWQKLVAVPSGESVFWGQFSGAHPLLAPFLNWMRSVDPDFARDDLRPFVRRYWQVGDLARGATSISTYTDKQRSPSLLERPLGKGRIVQFTTPLDVRFVDENRRVQWNNFWTDSSFGLVLIDRVCRYLGGEISVRLVNFTCGEVPRLTLSAPPNPPLSLSGPGLAGAERTVKPPAEDGVLSFPQAVVAGNYLLFDGKNALTDGFSLNVASREGNLDRVPVEELEEAIGTGSVLQVGRSLSIKDVLTDARRPPIELLPYLMMLLLLALTVEGLLANRFYGRSPEPGGTP